MSVLKAKRLLGDIRLYLQLSRHVIDAALQYFPDSGKILFLFPKFFHILLHLPLTFRLRRSDSGAADFIQSRNGRGRSLPGHCYRTGPGRHIQGLLTGACSYQGTDKISCKGVSGRSSVHRLHLIYILINSFFRVRIDGALSAQSQYDTGMRISYKKLLQYFPRLPLSGKLPQSRSAEKMTPFPEEAS